MIQKKKKKKHEIDFSSFPPACRASIPKVVFPLLNKYHCHAMPKKETPLHPLIIHTKSCLVLCLGGVTTIVTKRSSKNTPLHPLMLFTKSSVFPWETKEGRKEKRLVAIPITLAFHLNSIQNAILSL